MVDSTWRVFSLYSISVETLSVTCGSLFLDLRKHKVSSHLLPLFPHHLLHQYLHQGSACLLNRGLFCALYLEYSLIN